MKIKLNLLFFIPIIVAVFIISLLLFKNRTVTLLVNGESTSYETKKLFIKDFLTEIDFQLNPLDEIIPSLNSFIKDDIDIAIEQASRFVIQSEGDLLSLYSTSRLLGTVLSEAGIQYSSSSRILLEGRPESASYTLDFKPFYYIEIASITNNNDLIPDNESSTSLSLQYDSFALDIDDHNNYSHNYSLTLAGVSPQQYNYLNTNNDLITFTRVSEEVVLDQYPINFSTIYQPLSTIPLDTETTVQAGEFGLEAQRKRVRFENGVETNSIVEDTWLVRPAVDRIVGVGTDISIQSINTADGPIEYYRAVTFYATSYSPARSGVDPSISWYGQVYCGGYTQYGFVAVDLDYVPCGTRLYIPGYGFGVAMDTGNFNGAWIDLGYDDDNWVPWSKPVTVYFLTPAPPIESIPWIIPPGSTPFLPGFTY